jgi:YHS domain-containing protein
MDTDISFEGFSKNPLLFFQNLSNKAHTKLKIQVEGKTFYIIQQETLEHFLSREKELRRQMMEDNNTLREKLNKQEERLRKSQNYVVSQGKKTLIKILQKFELFNNISDKEMLLILEDTLSIKKYIKDDLVFSMNDVDDTIYYVVQGEVGIYIGDLLKPIEIASLHNGNFFGEMAFISKEPRTATIRVKSKEAILLGFKINEDVPYGSELTYIKIYKNINKLLTRKISETNSKFTGGK